MKDIIKETVVNWFKRQKPEMHLEQYIMLIINVKQAITKEILEFEKGISTCVECNLSTEPEHDKDCEHRYDSDGVNEEVNKLKQSLGLK